MSVFSKKKRSQVVTDEIPEPIQKRLHLIYFIVKWILIGTILFFGFSFFHLVTAWVLGVDDMYALAEENGVLGHEYCGTFYVGLDHLNSFASEEDYQAYMQKDTSTEDNAAPVIEIVTRSLGGGVLLLLLILHLMKKKTKLIGSRYGILAGIFLGVSMLLYHIMLGMTVLLLLLIFLALRSGEKKTLFSSRASEYFILGGLLWLAGNILDEIKVFLKTAEQAEGMTGIFASPVYYMQLYNIAVIPVIMFCGGLILQRHEIRLRKSDAALNTRLLKYTGIAVTAGSAVFILYRLGVRTYELIRVMSGDPCTVKIPFTVMDHPYNKLINLPYEMAKTPQDYQNVVLFRFVKDFPVFVLSAAVVFLFVRVLFNASAGKLNTSQNRKYLNISMVLLVLASLWFNLMGIWEIDLLNNGFTGIYGNVTYTIALRSLTEPALYALVIWFFKTYLQAIPDAEQNRISA